MKDFEYLTIREKLIYLDFIKTNLPKFNGILNEWDVEFVFLKNPDNIHVTCKSHFLNKNNKLYLIKFRYNYHIPIYYSIDIIELKDFIYIFHHNNYDNKKIIDNKIFNFTTIIKSFKIFADIINEYNYTNHSEITYKIKIFKKFLNDKWV